MTSTRALIARFLADSAEPATAAAAAAAAGVHVTTARFHLDGLVAAGDAVRRTLRAGARGRPRLGFSPAPSVRAEPARATMITTLARVLEDAEDGAERARDAGRTWADGLGGDLPGVLGRLGFDPAPEGDDIRLRSCPFAEAAERHPGIVCEVHRGLVERIAARDSETAHLVPFASPSGCLVRR